MTTLKFDATPTPSEAINLDEISETSGSELIKCSSIKTPYRSPRSELCVP